MPSELYAYGVWMWSSHTTSPYLSNTHEDTESVVQAVIVVCPESLDEMARLGGSSEDNMSLGDMIPPFLAVVAGNSDPARRID